MRVVDGIKIDKAEERDEAEPRPTPTPEARAPAEASARDAVANSPYFAENSSVVGATDDPFHSRFVDHARHGQGETSARRATSAMTGLRRLPLVSGDVATWAA